MKISELSVRRPVFATVISMMLVIFGLVSLQRLSVREYPDIDRPIVSITTAYRGASAAIIETKITQIIEDSVAGIEGILKIESDSEDERSQVRIEFDVNRDVDAAANDVRDRVARVVDAAARRSRSAADREGRRERRLRRHARVQRPTRCRCSTSRTTRSATSSTACRPCPASRAWPSSAGAATRCASGSTARRSPRATHRDATSRTHCAARTSSCPAGRLESRTREFSLRTMVGLETEQDFRNLVIARGDGRPPRAARRGRGRAARGGERALLQPLERRARPDAAGAGAVEGQHARHRARRARRGRAHASRRCRAGTTLDVSVDNAMPIEAALREVLIAIAFALDVRALR